MRVLEKLFCNCVLAFWIGLFVRRPGGRPEERPIMPGSSGEACRCLIPDRTVLPGW